jgi:hypothetical protein
MNKEFCKMMGKLMNQSNSQYDKKTMKIFSKRNRLLSHGSNPELNRQKT